jgi:hypothetical protein
LNDSPSERISTAPAASTRADRSPAATRPNAADRSRSGCDICFAHRADSHSENTTSSTIMPVTSTSTTRRCSSDTTPSWR